MANEYVRVCPVCDTENPPDSARCACGAMLSGVDFSLKRSAAETAAVEQASSPTAAAAEAPLVCPHADCAQVNPPGEVRCIYRNRALTAAESAPALATPSAAPAFSGSRRLPAALRDDYREVESFPVSGSEADILLVEDVKTGERRVAKLYRRGLQPDFRLLTILSQTVGDTVVRVLAHGISEGVAYELLEYVPGGTLED